MTRRAFFATIAAAVVAAKARIFAKPAARTLAKPEPERIGMSIRLVAKYDRSTNQVINRVDVLYGWSEEPFPEHSVMVIAG